MAHTPPPNKPQQPTIAPKRAIAAERQRRWAGTFDTKVPVLEPSWRRKWNY